MISLYFHIPFCKRKCDYCHFYVLPDRDLLKTQLLNGLKREWQLRLPSLQGKKIISIYFGGGTPALFGPERISAILEWIKRDAALMHDAEITLEANPENMDPDWIKAYQMAGINRISIGIQSLENPLLKILSRNHEAELAIQAVHTAHQAGIHNISIDLMYDLPDQKLSDWEKTLSKAVELPITHLSLYNLTIEPCTVFFKYREGLIPRVPSAETSLHMYQLAVDALAEAGLIQYEISAFCKNRYMSQHNIGYWKGRPFLGFGPSAFSYWEGHRFRNIAHLNKYENRLRAGEFPVDFDEKLELEEKKRELLTIRLRMMDGINIKAFEDEYGSLSQETLHSLNKLVKMNLIQLEEENARLTRRGILCYDSVASELI